MSLASSLSWAVAASVGASGRAVVVIVDVVVALSWAVARCMGRRRPLAATAAGGGERKEDGLSAQPHAFGQLASVGIL